MLVCKVRGKLYNILPNDHITAVKFALIQCWLYVLQYIYMYAVTVGLFSCKRSILWRSTILNFFINLLYLQFICKSVVEFYLELILWFIIRVKWNFDNAVDWFIKDFFRSWFPQIKLLIFNFYSKFFFPYMYPTLSHHFMNIFRRKKDSNDRSWKT